MICIHCSTPIPDGSRFCLSCGTDLSDPGASASTTAALDAAKSAELDRMVRQEVGSEFEPQAIQPLPDGSALLSGLAPISDVNERFDLSLSDEEYDTIGGYVFGLLGREPHEGDEVEIDGYRARVEALDGLRIDRLRLIPQQEARGG